MKLEFPWHIFEKKDANTKFHEILSSGSPVVPCGQMERRTDGWIDRHDEVFHCFANAPKNQSVTTVQGSSIILFIQIPSLELCVGAKNSSYKGG